MKSKWFQFVLFAAGPALVWSAPPAKPEFNPSGPTCFVNRTAAHENVVRAASKVAPQAAPVPSSPKILVIRVDFTDVVLGTTKSETELFFEKVSDFYLENSYGVFQPTFTISNSVHRIGTLATYGVDCRSDISCNDPDLRDAALNAEGGTGTNFHLYDQIMIYHAGFGQETTGRANDIWSVYFPTGFIAGGKIFQGFTIVPEKEGLGIDALGVICHEYGHQLGLPDLYDTAVAGGASTVGIWDLMDFPYGAAPGQPKGGNPAHLGAWSKSFLGFISPRTLNSSGFSTQTSADVSADAVRLPVLDSDVGSANEYFLIEYRNLSSSATYDKSIPASGMLIWHIDETIASGTGFLDDNDVNSPTLNGRGRRGVEVVEADKTESYSGSLAGEATDVFGNGSTFQPPLSDAFNGLLTGLFISGVSGIGTAELSFQEEIPFISTIAVSDSVLVSTTLASSYGSVRFDIPPGRFGSGTSLFVSILSTSTLTALGQSSLVASIVGTGVGFFVGASASQQPLGTIPVTLDFSLHPDLAVLSGADLAQLTLARYNSSSGSWVPVPTVVNTSVRLLNASLDHFSAFQVMRAQPATSSSDVKIFPNPLRPSQGPTYSVINFSNLTADARLRIFTITGDIVREIKSNGAGLAVWDGKNDSGNEAASGVYLVVVEDSSGGGRKVYKVAVER